MNILMNYSSLRTKEKILIPYFTFLQIIILWWVFFYEQDWYLILYFCYHICFLIIPILVFNKTEYIAPIIITGLVGQGLYVLDVVISLSTGGPFFGYFEYYLQTTLASKILVFLAHFSTLVLFFAYVREIKPTFYHAILSVVYFAISYFPARFIAPQSYNVQGVFTSYTFFDNLPLFTDLYIIYTTIVVVIPTYLLYLYLHKLFEKKENVSSD